MALLVGGALVACGGARPEEASIDSLPWLTVDLDLRIEGHEADLVPVTWMGVRSDGVIALIQWQDGNVRFFDSRGESLGSVGRSGDGPGEFRRPVRGGWIGDTLWVGDTQLDRVTLISPHLEVVRTTPQPRSLRPRPGEETDFPEFMSATAFAVYAGDTLLVGAIPVRGDPRAAQFEGSPLLRVSPDGVVERVVFERPVLEGSAITVDLDGGGVALSPIPFIHRPYWAVSPRGDRVGSVTTAPSGPDAGTFRVTVVDSHAERVFSRAYPFEGEPIPEVAVDSAVEAAAERANYPELRRAVLSDMKALVPPVYNPLTSVSPLVFGADGRVWVGLRQTDDGNPWLLLGPDGEPRGRFVVPGNVALRGADGTHVWGLERDELDIESVVRFRVLGSVRRADG